MQSTEIKQRITQKLDNLNSEQLVLVEKLLTEITAYFQTDESLEIKEAITANEDDPLAQLRNSDFIGCFEDEPYLAEKSEEIAQEIISKRNSVQS